MQRPRLNQRSKIWNFVNVQATHTQDPLLKWSKRDVYDASEWAIGRSIQEFYSAPTRYAFTELYYEGDHQIKAALELMQVFDFASYSHIGEIGGVPFRQLITILNSNPHLNFLATDFDLKSLTIFSNELSKFKNLESINNNEKSKIIEFARISQQGKFEHFDLIRSDLDLFVNCDIVMMWGVDYALEDSELRKLFSFIKANNSTLIVGTIIPMSFAVFLLEKLKRNDFLRKLFGKNKIKLRLHGYFRSIRYFKELAGEYDLNSTTLLVDDWYAVLEFK
jgi:hypothetical protein